MTDIDTNNIDFDKRSGVEALVARFGGLRPCAARLGLAVGTVQGWKKRGSIPPAHQQKIRELLNIPSSPPSENTSSSTTQAQAEEEVPKEQKSKKEDKKDKKEKDMPSPTPSPTPSPETAASEEGATEEGIVSAFTSGDDFAGGDDEEGLDISSEVWEHASLPRSTSGQWAILISLIALAGVVTRPLWAEPIDTKLMGTFDDGGHATSQSSPSHTSDGHDEGTQNLDDKTLADKSDDGSGASSADLSSQSRDLLPRDLLVRLEGLEREMAGVNAQQSAPAAAELRRLKSESDALAAAFDNQSARLDSLNELLQRRAEALAHLRGQVERLEQNRATEHLSRRLNALFQLENIAYAIAQRSTFSLESLQSSLSLTERETLEGALAILLQANDMSSPQRLLADYRRLLPDLLVWHAMGKAEQDTTDQGAAARFAQKLRAQLFGIFSLRRRYDDRDGNPNGDSDGDKETALLSVERMLEDGRFQQAAARLAQASPSNAEAREQLGEEAAAQLQAFRAALSSRNSVFAALHEIRAVLSSRETGEPVPRQPSS